ncbi:MAG: threonine aldolase family protein [Solirubrobacterales bacterium]
MRDFASDNHAGVHPELLEAIVAANEGHAAAYGADEWTASAEAAFREHFGAEARAYPMFNGSGANVAAIDALTGPHEAVICTDVAHMHVDECGAPERVAGTKLLTVAHTDGKLTPGDIARWESSRGDEHRAQPRVVSITQATELGTVYSLEETRAISDAAHRLGMHVHLDGARLANAAASLGLGLGELTTDAGVDVVSFGATKNGALVGDAVVILNPELGASFAFTRKQLGQLASKMRFISAQLQALLAGDLWLRNATHANEMARTLAAAVGGIEGVELAYPVEANAVFARLARPMIDDLMQRVEGDHPFYVWDEPAGVVRWMCSWDTSTEDVEAFAAAVSEAARAAA